jgi:hypothetical protein
MSDDAEQVVATAPRARADAGAAPRTSWSLGGWFAGLSPRTKRILFLAPLLLTLVDYWVLDHIPMLSALPHHSTLDFDRRLAGGTVPTVWLQDHAFHAHALHWYDYVAFFTYCTHFVVWPIVALTLWLRDYETFRRFAPPFVLLTFAGYATYLLWPVAPPWMSATDGLMPAVHRLPLVVMRSIGMPDAIASQFDGTSISAAVVGAIPSLHAAYPVLFALCFWKTRRWVRPVVVAYIPMMAISLVYGGEHFVGDVFLGWLYAIVSWTLVELVRGRRRASARVTRDAPVELDLALDVSPHHRGCGV